MTIEENISLKPYTTFMTEAQARFFAVVESPQELITLIKDPLWKKQPFILGGGSNILFTQDYEGLVVINNIKGKNIIAETNEYIDVEFMAGESWHECVMWAVDHNLWGIENLVLIPGTIGASPVQNIGAYGVEAADTIHSVVVINTGTQEKEILFHDECQFGYRDSIFKQQPEKYIVTSVIYRLSKKPDPKLSYGSMQIELEKRSISEPRLKDIAETIITIRSSKLPAVGSIGMAGSFFKNPIVSKSHIQDLLGKYPDMPHYALENGSYKIPAGWIIETLGYKGHREGDVGTYENHALVLVNYANAHGSKVWEFAKKIMKESREHFDVTLEPEVIIM